MPGPSAAGAAAGTTSLEEETQGSTPALLSFEASDGSTCACADDSDFAYGKRITLGCFQDAFKACESTLTSLSPWPDADGPPWVYTRHEGCGHTVFNANSGFGGPTCVYDSATKQLIGARMSTDAALEQCSTGVLYAGVQDNCEEGTLCSLSSRDSSCVDAAPLCAGKPKPCMPGNYPPE